MNAGGHKYFYISRLYAFLVLMMLCSVALVARAVQLQVMETDFLQGQGKARYLREVELPTTRGVISDRNGEPLAVSTPVDSVWVNPQILLQHPDRITDLAEALEADASDVERKLTQRAKREFVWLKRRLHPTKAQEITQLNIPGVFLQKEYRRFYPAGEVAAHLIGFTNIDDIGQEGLELAYNDWLQGKPGRKRVIRDRKGRTVEEIELVRESEPGRDLKLTIDRRLQYLAYRELKRTVLKHGARSGTVILMDVKTGEVLAMVNQPSYNPNQPVADSDGLRNRAVTDVFEPGSVMKPFAVLSALENGIVTPTTPIDTNPGWVRLAGYTIQDHHNYGVLDVTGIITKSSNVGVSQIALQLDAERMWDTYTRFGFGEATGTGFPGESAGVLRNYQRWRRVEQATISYGYGISVTPLQLAQAFAAVADEGRLRQPSLILGAGNPAVSVADPAITRVVAAMLETVPGPEGTGKQARVDNYRVAGKTGTSRKASAAGYASRYVASFAGFAPASDPRLICVAVINDPTGEEYYGGAVAAPLYASVMRGALRLMNVAPDDYQGALAGTRAPGGDCAVTYGMSLRALLEGWLNDVPEVAISGLSVDSRKVEPGHAFIAMKGATAHGMQFAEQAVANGCVAVIHDGRFENGDIDVPMVLFEDLPQRLGELASRFWAAPSEEMTIAAVTGTNGKTSVTHFLAQAWQQVYQGAGLIGTLGYGPFDRLQPATHTTPDPLTLNEVLAACIDDGINHVAMEVSSHALDQRRCDTVQIDAAVFTNISRDHLDYHDDMQAYTETKKRLFTEYAPSFAIINRDDMTGRRWIDELSGSMQVLGYGLMPGAELSAEIRGMDADGMALALNGPWGAAELRTGLLGTFNVSNLLAAAGTLVLLGMSWEETIRELELVKPVPGRMMRLGGQPGQPVVVIDYAHTPDALAQSLAAVRDHLCGRLVCVFGCGGNRDRGKRAQMGRLAESLTDQLVVTSDNPRYESVNSIINDVLAGMEQPGRAVIEPDRTRAIHRAIAAAGPGDIVLIAGKGHESWQEVAGQRIPFSDEATVQAVLGAAA